MLTIIDEYTHECYVLRPERALRAADVLAWLERAIREHGAPAFLRNDNGPEFITKEVPRWLADYLIKTIYIDQGSPWQNDFVESFHGRFCDECLNQEVLWTLTEARVVSKDFRRHYNERRPRGKLGYQSATRFADLQHPLTPSFRLGRWTTQPNVYQSAPGLQGLRVKFLHPDPDSLTKGYFTHLSLEEFDIQQN